MEQPIERKKTNYDCIADRAERPCSGGAGGDIIRQALSALGALSVGVIWSYLVLFGAIWS